MPNWLKNQMQKAFYEKNHYQIKLLNQCWYFYRKNIQSHQGTPHPKVRLIFLFTLVSAWRGQRGLLPGQQSPPIRSQCHQLIQHQADASQNGCLA